MNRRERRALDRGDYLRASVRRAQHLIRLGRWALERARRGETTNFS